MREIIFRGKCLNCQKFKYGDLEHSDDEALINAFSFFNKECWCDASVYVDPETVGQYTGLTDKNGVKIFEGDVVRCVSRLDYTNMVVIFEDGEFRMVKCEDYKTYTTGNGYFSVRCFYKEVIGNIYDNPELIGGNEDENSI